jgi:integrase
MLNLQIAKAYLLGADSAIAGRTWGDAMSTLTNSKQGSNKERWERAAKDKALAAILPLRVVETKAEDILKAIQVGCVSTNNFLRRLHNFAVDMNWLPWPLIPRRQWPAIRHKEKRAITEEEHLRIVAREGNPGRKAFYELSWHLGASQSDLAHLHAEDVDWESMTISYVRMKIRWRANQTPPQIRFGNAVESILKVLPAIGPLFPYLMNCKPGHRATEFRQRCQSLGINGITLHSYRYAWAERTKIAGYPERFAQLGLGHNSKAVHRAYAKRAQVTLPPLEEFEATAKNAIIIPLQRDSRATG